jgi:hypothetical protein
MEGNQGVVRLASMARKLEDRIFGELDSVHRKTRRLGSNPQGSMRRPRKAAEMARHTHPASINATTARAAILPYPRLPFVIVSRRFVHPRSGWPVQGANGCGPQWIISRLINCLP